LRFFSEICYRKILESMTSKTRIYLLLIAALSALFGFQSCAPVFSELQSARLVGKNKFELTPLFSTVSATGENNTDHLQNELGLQAIFGLSDAVDLRFRSEVIWAYAGDYYDANVIFGLGPKFRILENKIALSLPFGTVINSNIWHEWQFQPTLLLTLPAIKDKLDITLSPKYIIPFCDDCDNFGAINIGLAISSDLSKWAIRPEYGHLYDFGSEGHVGQFSIGLSKTFGK